ncbi:MAG: nitroreductase family protein [Candidatus Omnitrophota bacterium]|nr:nitroreductase family protein [Candidatus Omnitrophota bacterium]
MTFLDLVKKRRSVRKYANRSVPREIISRCIEAARLAPSACNSQPWYFIIVDDEELKKQLARCAFSGIYSMNSFAGGAAAFVVTVRDKSSYFARLAGAFRGVEYNLVDIGIACEHLILQAEEDGVGTCWLGWFNERAVKKVLGIPKNKKADIIISMGYSNDLEPRDKVRKPVEEICKFNIAQ